MSNAIACAKRVFEQCPNATLSTEEIRLNFYDTVSKCIPNQSGGEAQFLCNSYEISCATFVVTHWSNEFVADEMRLKF